MKKVLQMLLKNGLFLAIITALGYLFAYFYLKGFYSYYGLPMTLINISIPLIINSILIVFTMTVLLLFGVNAILSILNMLFSLHPYFLKWLRVSITLGFLLLAFELLKKTGVISYIIISIIIAIWIFAFLYLIKYRKIKPWSKKLDKANEGIENLFIFGKTQETKSDDVSSCKSPLLKKAISSIQVLLGLAIIILILQSVIGVIFTEYGSLNASNKREYYVAVDYDNEIIVYQDNDKFILLPYDNETNKFTLSYRIVTLENIGTIKSIILAEVSFPKVQTQSISDILNSLVFY